jgi:hypothetical protein
MLRQHYGNSTKEGNNPMIQRTCQACGAGFATMFEDTLLYCIDCSEAPVPTTAEVYGQIPVLPTVYAEIPTVSVPLLTPLSVLKAPAVILR